MARSAYLFASASYQAATTGTDIFVGDFLQRTLSSLRGFFDSLQFFPGLEAHRFARRNVHLCPGARVTANARLTRLNAENPEASQLDALAAAERVFQRFKDRFDSLLGLSAADVRRRHDGVYDIELNHVFLQRLGRC